MSALRRRYGRAKGPMDNFRTAARKIEKMIVEFKRTGGDTTEPFLASLRRLHDAANKLYDRLGKPEIRGEPTLSEEAWSTVTRLKQEIRDAEPIAFQARQGKYHGEINALKEREHERIASMSPHERATYNYQQELKLTRGR